MSIAFSSLYTQGSNRLNSEKSAILNSNIENFISNDPLIDIHVSCKNVVKLDVGSQSDPMCVLMVKNQNGAWKKRFNQHIINCTHI